MFEIPENQMDIFDILEALAEVKNPNWATGVRWQQNPLYPLMINQVAYLLVKIPETILSPMALPGMYDRKIQKMKLWSAYVNAICDGEEINFGAARELLEVCRKEEKSVKIRLTEGFTDIFEELEVVEYL